MSDTAAGAFINRSCAFCASGNALTSWNHGKLDDALDALAQSERFCRRHRVTFDQAALRRDIQREQTRAA